MTDLLMNVAGLDTAELRARLATARITIRNAKTTIDDVEHDVREKLLASVGGNVKDLGSNEQLREDRYRSEYAKRAPWIRYKAELLGAQDEAEMLQAVLDGRLDGITERRLTADERRTDILGRLVESGAAVGALA